MFFVTQDDMKPKIFWRKKLVPLYFQTDGINFMQRFWMLVISVLLLLIAYTYFKISQFLLEQKFLALLLTLLLFAIMGGWEIIYRYRVYLVNRLWFRVVAWVGSTLLGILVTFIFFSLLVDIGRLIFLVVTTFNHTALLDQAQSVNFSQWISIVIFIISVLIAGFGLKTAWSGPKIIQVLVPIKSKLFPLIGMKIVQISDLHVGVMIRRDYVEKVVQKVNGIKPDIIVLTGDVADGVVDALYNELSPLAKLQAPLGKFYVTGNHEYYWGGEHWVKGMSALGFIPLLIFS